MNDRSQGASALDEGRIEFMQHRRVPADDNKGVDEFLNERDSNGNGIRVPASYYVQLHSLDERASEQRLLQHKTDDPAQYFFSESSSMTTIDHDQSLTQNTFSDYLALAGIEGLVKMVSIPMARDKVMVRIQNMADLFDSGDKESLTQTVNIKDIARAMWLEAN